MCLRDAARGPGERAAPDPDPVPPGAALVFG